MSKGIEKADKGLMRKGGGIMLWSIAAVLTVLWFLGMITSTMLGGFLHYLLVIVVIVIVVKRFPAKNRSQIKLPPAPKYQRVHRSFTESENVVW